MGSECNLTYFLQFRILVELKPWQSEWQSAVTTADNPAVTKRHLSTHSYQVSNNFYILFFNKCFLYNLLLLFSLIWKHVRQMFLTGLPKLLVYVNVWKYTYACRLPKFWESSVPEYFVLVTYRYSIELTCSYAILIHTNSFTYGYMSFEAPFSQNFSTYLLAKSFLYSTPDKRNILSVDLLKLIPTLPMEFAHIYKHTSI